MAAEDEVEAQEVDSTYSTKGIQTFNKKMEAIEELSEQGGVMLNKVGKQCHLIAITAEKLAIAKRSAEKEEASRLPQADSTSTSNLEDGWFVDSGASHHIVEYECIVAIFTLSLGQSRFRLFL